MPFSSCGVDNLRTKPFWSPSFPGQGNAPALEDQYAEQALAAKSYIVPAIGVGDGPGVPGIGVVGTAVDPETVISTHQDLVPSKPIPNGIPFESLNFQ